MRFSKIGQVLVAALLCVSLWSPSADAARKFNGTNSDTLISASTFNFSSYNKYTVAFWFWSDVFDNSGGEAFETWESGVFDTDAQPNANGVGGKMYLAFVGNIGTTDATVPRPSAAAWHHYIINYDETKGTNQYDKVYIDGVSQTVTYLDNVANTGNFLSTASTLYLMNHRNSSQYALGRIADVAIWFGGLASQTDATNLAAGTYLPDSALLSVGAATYYWKICGATSPELPTLGTINLTVAGTVDSPHPSAVARSCSGRLVGDARP